MLSIKSRMTDFQTVFKLKLKFRGILRFQVVMGRVRTRTREKDSDLGFFAGLGLGLGLAVGKVGWTRTRTRVQH